MELIILAAGRGTRIYRDIKKNKCLLCINHKSLIKKIVDDAIDSNLFNKIKIVVGYKKERIFKEFKKYKVEFIVNKDYLKTEMLHSLKLGIKSSKQDTLISYSDIYYNPKIFNKIANSKRKKYILPVFKSWKKIWKIRNKNILDDCESLIFDKQYFLKEIGQKIKNINEPMGQFMGLFYIPKQKINSTLKVIESKSREKKIHTTKFINLLVKFYSENIFCLKTNNYWYEFDDYKDYKNYLKK